MTPRSKSEVIPMAGSGRLGCSTISFRARPLPDALAAIAGLGLPEADLGMLPGVCEHAPLRPGPDDVRRLTDLAAEHGIRWRSLNTDPADLNSPRLHPRVWRESIDLLARATAGVGAPFLAVPNGRQRHQPFGPSLEADLATVVARLHEAGEVAAEHGVRLLVEAPHVYRLCRDTDRSDLLLDRLDPERCGLIYDVSHVVASGGDAVGWARTVADRVDHVHLRDARPGDINLSVGNGKVDFEALIDALESAGYQGHYTLELETHDVADTDREAVAARSAARIEAALGGARPTEPAS
ncbi:sugar phosphate isomerase/epimerase [Streptomyces luomodiensis]|uniref:Sugar phosphate isomerase/epimerase n=1 Tax=Streptomyces luomodiensis TaxID=3026192 RepID=A0ABY9UXR0_9ACTN|nr:sugar phosphate isomerase/epimerase [Streptomyces sp. SCA4-21]WNE95260.1 sugar phosphate isomerase/epimerase [Streptomyces sp. SCA4-21]